MIFSLPFQSPGDFEGRARHSVRAVAVGNQPRRARSDAPYQST
jgi:hypothetical protein